MASLKAKLTERDKAAVGSLLRPVPADQQERSCSPLLSRPRAPLLQPVCVIGAVYNGSAFSDCIDAAQLDSRGRQRFVEEAATHCFSRKTMSNSLDTSFTSSTEVAQSKNQRQSEQGLRLHAAATVTLTDNKVEIATHVAPFVNVCCFKNTTAYCARSERYPSSFGLVRSVPNGTVCEVFSTPTQHEAVQCVTLLARSFGVMVTRSSSADDQHIVSQLTSSRGRRKPSAPIHRMLAEHVTYRGFAEVSHTCAHVCERVVAVQSNTVGTHVTSHVPYTARDCSLGISKDNESLVIKYTDVSTQSSGHQMISLTSLTSCYPSTRDPTRLFLARSSQDGERTFVHVFDAKDHLTASRVAIVLDSFIQNQQWNVQDFQKHFSRILHGHSIKDSTDLLQTRIDLLPAYMQTKLRAELLEASQDEESEAELTQTIAIISHQLAHMPPGVLSPEPVRTLRTSLAASLDSLISPHKDRRKGSPSCTSPSSPLSARTTFGVMSPTTAAVPATPPPKPAEEYNEQFRSPAVDKRWKESLFQKVLTRSPRTATPGRRLRHPSRASMPQTKTEQIRARWRKAVQQQLLLLRMDKENKLLHSRKDVAQEKARNAAALERVSRQRHAWDALLQERIWLWSTADVRTAAAGGIPESYRGRVWRMLCDRLDPLPSDLDSNYLQLLTEPCIYLHAVKIDIDRAFPQHEMFREPMGVGQKALFNCMRAYSVLDAEVGYCQGMSFIGAMLIMHDTEENAFHNFTRLMYSCNLRGRYLPDMLELKLYLYQLSRLVHDRLPNVYRHFEEHDVEPFLYATPWFLTLFSTQFSLQFSQRVLDLVFASGSDVLFVIAIALLELSEPGLLSCSSFERILNFLQTSLPKEADVHMDAILQRTTCLNIDKARLDTYAAEFQQLQDVSSGLSIYSGDDEESLDALRLSLAEANVKLRTSQKELSIASQQVNHAKSALQTLRHERDEALAEAALLRQELNALKAARHTCTHDRCLRID